MDTQEFLKQEYITLREEIRETKIRKFRTIGFGLVIVPIANFLAEAYKIDIITLSLPVLVIVVSLVYMSENNALMRCGKYIRVYIEPKVGDIIGWEAWLESKNEPDTRNVDKHLTYAFYLLFFVYSACSVFIAVKLAISMFNILIAACIIGLYVAVGIWFVIFLIRNTIITTK